AGLYRVWRRFSACPAPGPWQIARARWRGPSLAQRGGAAPQHQGEARSPLPRAASPPTPPAPPPGDGAVVPTAALAAPGWDAGPGSVDRRGSAGDPRRILVPSHSGRRGAWPLP